MKFGVLQITGPDGSRRDLPLDLPSLVVGRADGNAIIIDDLSVSRRHARLTIDSGRLLVEDLGSAQGTFVNGVRIVPNVPNLVEDDAELRFGDIEVRYEPPPPAEAQLQPGVAALPGDADAERGADFAIGSRLGVTLVAPNAPVIAGAPWIATLHVHNRSNVVDRVAISVPDLPESWVRLDRAELALPPGAAEIVQLTIIPPRKAESLAGDYDFTVQVSSFEHQREASTLGRFTLAPFQNLALSFEAPRSKRDFLVVTENRGNEAATYALEGEDPDAAYRYEFELPSVALQPGERRTVGLRVHHKTPLFGVPIALSFNVHAESDGPRGQKVTALGQLASRPPLQKFVGAAMFVVAVAVISLVAVSIMLLSSDSVVTSANAESKYSGVHMCDKDEAAKAEARQKQEDAAVPKPSGGRALVTGSDPSAPFFAQNDPRWGKDEYAKAKDPEFGPDWCGSTIEQCGCAMTSVATTMAIFGLLTMPDGSPLTPQAMNSWFNEDAKKTNRGWVSRGYIYGDVIWTAANQLSGEMAKARPGTPTIRFSRTGSGSDDEIREQLKLGRPIILEVPGHWIAATGLDPKTDAIQINDPYYRDRTTLDSYKGKVKSSVIFEPSDDLSAVVFTAPSDVRVRITDKQGRVVGSLTTGTAEDAALDANAAKNQIPGASYTTRQAWRDPSCVETAPPADAGTNQIILPGSADDYKIEVLDASGKPTSIAIHTYDKQGKSSVQTIDNPGSAVAQLSVDPAAGKSDVKVIAGAQPTPAKTESGGDGGGNPTVAPPATATKPPAPTPTPEPVVETGLAISAIPGDNFVAIQSQDGFSIGDTIIFSPGKANEEENRIIGFGSFILEFPLRFAHSPGETIRKKPRPPGSSAATERPLPPPVVIPPLAAPEELVLGCSALYVADPKEATLICTLDVTGTFTTTRWTLNGKSVDEVNNQQLLLMTFNSDGNAAVGVSVCNRTICKATSFQQKIQFPAPGATGGTGGTAGANGGTATTTPTQTPPATGVVVNCTTQFEQGTNPRAVVTCAALFSGPSTSVSWIAPGAVPAAGQGKTFTTDVPKGTLKKLRVTATVCNFAVCQTSPNVDINIGGSTTKVFLKTVNPGATTAEVPLDSTTTFTAIVTGPPPPAGGTVQFNDGLVAVGPSVPLFTAGSVGFAQYTFVTGTSPLTGVGTTHQINAVYSGGTNVFGSFSADSPLKLTPPVPEVCNALDDETESPPTIDDGCDLTLPKDIGGGTIAQVLRVSGSVGPTGVVSGNNTGDIVVRPGAPITVTANLTRFPDCAGCIRQVYLAVGPNLVNGAPAIGPVCVYSGGVGTATPGVSTTPWTISAPTLPGIYYVRAASTLDSSCVQATPLGPPDLSLGRIVVQAASTTSISLSSASIDLGAPVTVTAAVSPVPQNPGALGLPNRGVLRVTDGGSSIGADAFVDAQGQATFTYTPSGAGPHTLKAEYFGYPASQVFAKQWYDASANTGGTEPTANLDVRTGSTTVLALTAVGAPVTTTTVGTTITATVTVTPDSPFSTDGSPVSLSAGGVPVTTTPAVPTLTNGTATFTFVAGDAGVPNAGTTYQIRATFGGATYVGTSSSGAAANPLTITKATPAIVLGTTSPMSPGLVPNPAVAGDTLVLTATVTGAPFAFPSGGTVEFRRSGGQLIATATVSAPPSAIGIAQTSIPLQELVAGGGCGVAVAPTPVLDCISDAGSYIITAKFIAFGNLNDSPTSAPETLVVTAAPVTVAITAFDASATAGGSGKIDIKVSPVAGGKVPGLVTGTVSLFDGVTPLPSGANLPLVNVTPLTSPDGTVSYPLNDLDVGTYANITVHYNASTKYSAGESTPPVSVTITKAATPIVTTITNTGAIAVGDIVQLRAVVGGGSSRPVLNPDPGATVQFMAGTNAIGGPRALTSGVATLSWTSGNVGGFPLDTAFTYNDIHAVYSGNANLNPATSPNISLTLTKRAPTVTISITPSTQTIGGSVDFSASVSAGAINPDGAFVQFKAGTNNIGTPVLVVGGTASLANYVTGVFPFDTAAAYTDVHADYDGTNSNVGAGSSANATLTLNKAPSGAIVAAIANVNLGNSGSFTVNVTGTAPFPVNGSAGNAQAQFYKGATAIGSAVTVSAGGVATYNPPTGPGTDFTASGTFAIHAVYLGTSQLASSTSADVSFTIDPSPTATVLVITGGTLTAGGAGTLTASISPNPASTNQEPVTGTVTFISTQGTLGTVAVTNPLGHNGQAVLNISGLNANSYTNVVATYADATAKYAGSASTPAQAFTIQKATPTVTLTSPVPNPGSSTDTIGTTFTFSASVGGSGVLSPNGGTVTFKAGGTAIPSATATVSGGIASVTVTTGASPLDTGGVTYPDITAEFVDDGPNLNTVESDPGSLVLNKAAVNIAMSGPSTTAFGSAAVTITATVTAPGTSAAIGNGAATVTFSIGGFPIGSPVLLSGGTASVDLTAGTAPIATAGDYTITATYNGSSQVATGSNTKALAVTKVTPTVMAANNGPVGVGSSVTMTATISGTGSVPVDGGVVTFRVGATNIGTAVVGGAADANCGGGTGSTGVATCTVTTGTAPLTASATAHTVTTDFAATAQVNSGTDTTAVAVNRAQPTVTFTSGIGSVVVGSSISFVVNVSGSGSKSPTGGTVSLYIGSTGTTAIATASVSGNTATFTAIATGAAPFPTAGTYSIIARFNGNATNGNVAAADSDSSPPQNAVVTQVAPTVTFTGASTASAALGTAVSIVVNVTGSGITSPAGGTVELFLTDFSSASIATSAAILSGSNTATFAFTAGSSPFPNAGPYSLVARYNGNTNVAASNSSLGTPHSLTVTQVSSTTTLTVAPLSAFSTATTYTFTAKITPATFGGHSGSVSFQDDVSGSFVQIGTGSISLVAGEYVATFSTTFAAGTHHIRAVYAGNTNFTGSMSSSITVGP